MVISKISQENHEHFFQRMFPLFDNNEKSRLRQMEFPKNAYFIEIHVISIFFGFHKKAHSTFDEFILTQWRSKKDDILSTQQSS